MANKQIIATDNLITGADLALQDAVTHWKALERDALLDEGDKLNEINRRSQLAIGAWLVVFEDELGYGAMTELADRWDRKPNTLSQWKRVYLRTRNVERAKDLPFGKLQELARIPEPEQAAWLPAVTDMKRDDLRKAVLAAKQAGDWTSPKGDIVILEPEPESSEPLSENVIEVSPLVEDKSDDTPPETSKGGYELSARLGRLGTVSVRWQPRSKG